jgi:hypothetical protein
MSNSIGARRIILFITAQKRDYYRTRLGKWTGNLDRARNFATTEEAQGEADRIGAFTFQGEPCHPAVHYVETL